MSDKKSGAVDANRPNARSQPLDEAAPNREPVLAAFDARSTKPNNKGRNGSSRRDRALTSIAGTPVAISNVSVADLELSASTSALKGLPGAVGKDFNAAAWSHPSVPSDVRESAERIILAHYAPAGVVVDADGQIIYFHGDTSAYMRPMSGNASLDILKLVRRQIAIPIRSALQAAKKQGKRVHRKGAPYVRDGQICRTDVEVAPIYVRATKNADFLVLFRDQVRRHVATSSEGGKTGQVGRLKQDLAATRKYIRTILREHETATEELWVAHEEIIANNEELQRANEDLQSLQEEAQCANEELKTLNEELQTVTSDLTETANDLAGALNALDIPLLVVDDDQRIRHFTSAAENLFNLTSNNVGRYLDQIQPQVDIPDLVDLTSRVITSMRPVEREVRDERGHWYLFRMQPYKVVGNPAGAVLTLTDIQDVQHASGVLMEAIRAPFLVLDSQFRVVTANRAFYEKFRRKREETENRVLFDLGPGQWNPQLRELLHKVVREKYEVTDFEVQYDTHALGHMIMSVSARQLDEAGADSPKILLAIRDVTERRDREDKIQQLLARLMTAREDEGKRIARELHDSFGPRLARVNLLVSGVQGQLVSQPDLSNELERIKAEVSEVAKASHDLSYGLHPSALSHLGIEAALESQCVNFSKAAGITVTFSGKNVPDSVPDTAALCLYRIAQEALQNIRRHAHAKAAAVTLTGMGPELVMFIRDSGAGFDTQAARAGGGLGLASMEERIRLVNGKVTVNSKLGEGTQVEVRIPVGTTRPPIRVRID